MAGRVSPDKNGFTLIELIIVMLIISLALGAAMPAFSRMGGGIKPDAGRVSSAIRLTADRSASTRQTLALKFDLDNKTMVWQDTEGMRELKIKSLDALRLQSRGLLKDGVIEINFDPIAMAEPFGVVLSDSGESVRVEFNPITRRVKAIAIDSEAKDQGNGG